MAEYIERAALIKAFYKDAERCGDPEIPWDLSAIETEIEDAPAADVAPVVHGRWIKRGNEKKCSVCEFIYYSNNDEWNFCPNCGAHMKAGDGNG